MIAHVVMLNLRDSADRTDLATAMAGLARVQGRTDGFSRLTHGENIDIEAKSPDFPYGFVAEFRDRSALARYAADPEHQTLGACLVALCKGGANGIVTFDINTRQGDADV